MDNIETLRIKNINNINNKSNNKNYISIYLTLFDACRLKTACLLPVCLANALVPCGTSSKSKSRLDDRQWSNKSLMAVVIIITRGGKSRTINDFTSPAIHKYSLTTLLVIRVVVRSRADLVWANALARDKIGTRMLARRVLLVSMLGRITALIWILYLLPMLVRVPLMMDFFLLSLSLSGIS